uniref:Uncharacterized protein n=1 Tax=Aegilops tauschii subsp. strangulata TaxID=200361 RepID=A0A453RJE4_AEGTS
LPNSFHKTGADKVFASPVPPLPVSDPGPHRAGSRVARGGVLEASATMEAADLAADGRIIKADFTDAGAYQLRERMREKLREFEGSAEDSIAVRCRHSLPPPLPGGLRVGACLGSVVVRIVLLCYLV